MSSKMTRFSTDSARRAVKRDALCWINSPAQATLWKEGACVPFVVLPAKGYGFGAEASCFAGSIGASFLAPVLTP